MTTPQPETVSIAAARAAFQKMFQSGAIAAVASRQSAIDAFGDLLRDAAAATDGQPDVYHRCGATLQHRPADGWDSQDHSDFAFFCPRCSVFTNMTGKA